MEMKTENIWLKNSLDSITGQYNWTGINRSWICEARKRAARMSRENVTADIT